MRSPRTDAGTAVSEAPSTASINLHNPGVTTSITGFRAFDVGQGDCFGLLDQNREVFCYVDYGGLAKHAYRNPPAMDKIAPVDRNGWKTPVILTHWDKDHYYSADVKNPKAQACPWLVPRQWVSPHGLKFAAKLAKAQCWPESQGTTSRAFPVGRSHSIEIQKCAPFDTQSPRQDRNRSGLAVAVTGFNSLGVACHMLLPGDCHYDGIPNPLQTPIRHLVAYHHGSGTHFTSATKLGILNYTSPRQLVYSYGQVSWTVHDQNYETEWNPHATHTPTLRGKSGYEDFVW